MRELPVKISVNYSRLLSDLSLIKNSIKDNIARKANKVLLLGYWAMGERLCAENIFSDPSTGEAHIVLNKLAEGLDIEYTLLTRIIKLYRTWPSRDIFQKNPNISWSHYKRLMAISDADKRDFYLFEAQKNKWNKQQLLYRVKNNYYEGLSASPADGGAVLERKEQRLYLYAAQLVKVVDGDTLVVCADLGFNVKVDVRLRLRGINTSEMTDQEKVKQALAQQAKNFVSDCLQNTQKIVFQSFKVDLYGRYVADIFYLPGETDKEKIFKQGRFLNQDLLDAGLAKLM